MPADDVDPPRLHHVQVVIPPGGERRALAFWRTLGFEQVATPASLAHLGGLWLRTHDASGAVAAEIHVGVDADFAPARRAHPAILVASVAALEATAVAVAALGVEVRWHDRTTFPGYERFHCADPFGNRVEVMTPAA